MTKKTSKTAPGKASKNLVETSDGQMIDLNDPAAVEEWVKSQMMSDEERIKWGLYDRDELVISFNPVRRTK